MFLKAKILQTIVVLMIIISSIFMMLFFATNITSNAQSDGDIMIFDHVDRTLFHQFLENPSREMLEYPGNNVSVEPLPATANLFWNHRVTSHLRGGRLNIDDLYAFLGNIQNFLIENGITVEVESVSLIGTHAVPVLIWVDLVGEDFFITVNESPEVGLSHTLIYGNVYKLYSHQEFVGRFGVTLLEVYPTTSPVLVNGENVAFQAYHINGRNFFKLRDIAYVLNGTAAEFSVRFSNAGAILITSGQAYVPVGGEMANTSVGATTATPTSSAILLNRERVDFTAYHIDGNNYFMLRDLGYALGFAVDWDEETGTISINTN